ncbi:MAG: AAA family ATPase [Bacteroidota bacterium]|nr:AAA family ATPase [Bacteroidota bacterium]
MYLKKISIQNFRAIKSLNLEFNKGVNVLIGENDTGKSAIIDALRICLGYGKQFREIGVKPSDFYIDRKQVADKSPEIEFHFYFEMEEPEIEGRYFIDLIHQDKDNPNHQEIQLHFRYWKEEKDEKENVRWEVWGGTHKGQTVPSEPLQLIEYTFLDALRDATQKLRPYSQNNKLVSLFENLIEYSKNGSTKLDKAKKKELAKKLVDWLQDDDNDWKHLIKEGETRVNEHLKESSIEDNQAPVQIGFSGYDYKDIVNNLQLSFPIYDVQILNGKEQRYFNLNQNGLGQNNLIYAATILGDLINRKEKGYYHALLIEEPEAHLHPQKQNTFFNYLNNLENKGIQIFITSHSPTITAKTELDFVTVLQIQNNDVSAVRLKDTNLTDGNKKYLEKFLDVTKSQLFFGKGVILVEGISEALLLPVFSRIMDFNFNKDKEEKDLKALYNLEKRGIEIVNVGGVAFDHFANLFIAPKQEKEKGDVKKQYQMLSAHCSILTDDDRHRPKNKGNKSTRAKNTENLERDSLKVKLATNTFEYELFIASDYNAKIIREVYEGMHTSTTLKRDGSADEQAKELLDKLDSNKDKSELAHSIAVYLDKNFEEAKSKFIVPNYIQQAIKWAVNEEGNGTIA